MTGVISQLGLVKETTWNTPVVVSKFFEYISESIAEDYQRMESASLRDANRMQRSDRWARNFKGASGTIELEVMSKGFGFWLEHMTGGTITTVGPTETTAYTHTAKIGSLAGKGFTCQVGRPFVASATVQPFTYSGGKVTGWELSNSVDGFLIARIDCDFASVLTATALAAETYPASMEILNFIGGVFSIAGTPLDVSDISIRCNNNLKTDRYFIRGNSQKKEPAETGFREIIVTGTIDYESQAVYNRVASATAAGAMADCTAKWEGSLAGATTIKNKLEAIMNTVRFDVFAPVVSGPDMLTGGFEARVLDDGDVNTALQLIYVTTDLLP